MARYLFVFAALIGCALTDNHGHHDHDHDHHDHDSAAPATAYGAPAPSYEAPAPSYEAPAPSYEAPAPSYEAPAPSYNAPAPSYNAPAPSYEAPAPSYGAPANPKPSYKAPANPVPSYGAPANPTPTYEAPAASAPTYAAPAVSYGAPAAEYGAPSDTYGAPQQYTEGYAAEADSEFDLSNISSLLTLPFFLAVFAAIIVSQLAAPILGTLSALDLASGILAPLEAAKIGLANVILSPFNLVLGRVGSCTPATARSLDAGWSMSPDDVLNLMFKANEIYNDFS